MTRIIRSPVMPVIGSPVYSPDDQPVYRGGGSSFSPLSLSPLAWARTPGVSSGASCSITLTGDIAALYGGLPMTISGQTASAVQTTPAQNFVASTDYIEKKPPPTSGIIVMEVSIQLTGSVGVGVGAIIGDFTTGNYLRLEKSTGGYSGWMVVAGVETSIFTGDAVEGQFAFGYGSDGSLYLYKDGVSYDTSALSEILPAGVFYVAVMEGGSEGDSATVSASTSGADFTQTYPAGTLDWCGNAIGGVDGLYQDSAGTTPVTGAGQDVGLREDQSGNSADFTQATATARPTYEGDRLEYDVDDALSCTLPAISGGQIVIISPAGTWIDDFDFAGGTFTVGPDTYTGGPFGLMAALGNEEIEIIILPTPMTEAEQAKMVSYAQGLGSAGLITFGVERKGDVAPAVQGTGTVSYDSGTDVWSIARIDGSNLGYAILAASEGVYFADTEWLSGDLIALRRNGFSNVGVVQSSAPTLTAVFDHSADGIRWINGANGTASTFRIVSIREVIMP